MSGHDGPKYAVSRVTTELLLLNIARSRWHHPIHFTAISSIAATFAFEVEGGIVTSDRADSRCLVQTILNSGARASENPTVTIVPVQGEEFTLRLEVDPSVKTATHRI